MIKFPPKLGKYEVAKRFGVSKALSSRSMRSHDNDQWRQDVCTVVHYEDASPDFNYKLDEHVQSVAARSFTRRF